MTAILIIEDEPETRAALEANVAAHPDFRVAAAVGTLAEAREALAGEPAVILVDLDLPDGNGIDLIREAARLDPRPEIMVITVFGDEQHVIRAITAGATGYLLKDSDTPAVGEAISQLLAGGSPITPRIARHVLQQFTAGSGEGGSARTGGPKLTEREVEVLTLVSRGYSNNEISELLKLSFHTVTSHIKHIYRKLSVRNRSEAIFEASQLGLLDLNR